MFTGLVEELGRVEAITDVGDGLRLTLACRRIAPDVSHGDSISVNGCCLTAVEPDSGGFSADVMHETLKRTNLGELDVKDPVNLERAMAADSRFGGHIVQGHVDGRGVVSRRNALHGSQQLRIAVEPSLSRYLIPQGSVTVDGVSLTVVSIDASDAGFTVSLIPTTLADTTLGQYAVGTAVNIEVDVLAKYVERLLPRAHQEGRT